MQTETTNETSQLKPWDHVVYIPGDKDIAGIVIKQEGNLVWITNVSHDCDIIIVKRDLLKKVEAPRLSRTYQWQDNLASRFRIKPDFNLSLYPSDIYRESAIIWRSLEHKAQAKGLIIYREHIGRDHYHYYIPALKAFCNEDYA